VFVFVVVLVFVFVFVCADRVQGEEETWGLWGMARFVGSL
jgi:hypothetical protein